MKSELQEKLLKKYPQFFTAERKIYIGKKSMKKEIHELLNQKEMVLPIQFGFECGDGWYMLLDELMGEIANHIENVDRNNKNVFKYQWMWNLQRYIRVRMPSKYKRLQRFAEWLYNSAPRKNIPPMEFQIDQIKEKYSTLRFYYHGGDDFIDGLVSLAESLSAKICENCGTTINVGRTSGWLITLCKSCAVKKGAIDNWKKNLEE